MENTESNKTDWGTNDGRNIAIIAYLTLIGLIIAYVLNNEKRNDFASYHIRQSLGIFISIFVLSAFNYIPLIGWAIASIGVLAMVILWVLGVVNAANGIKKPVPVLGEYFQELFASV